MSPVSPSASSTSLTVTSGPPPREEAAARIRRMLQRLGTVPSSPDGLRDFLQSRITFMFGLASALWLVTWVIDRVLCHFMGGDFWQHSVDEAEPHLRYHLGVGLGLLALTAVLRYVKPSLLALGVLETSVTLAQIFMFCLMLENAPLDLRPDLAMLLGSAHVLVLRAALVPASPRSATVLGTLSAVIVGLYSYVIWRDAPPGVAFAGKVSIPIINTVIWSVVSIVGTTAVSFVIYGLRKRVERAIELGQYTLLEKVGQGGMGVVYRARHALLRRPTAVKVLRDVNVAPPCAVLGRAGIVTRVCPPRSQVEQGIDEAALARFEREVQLTAQISHPNVVSVYDFGRSPEGAFYYAMEFLDGVDLQRLVDEHGPMPPARVAHVLAQIAEALAEAHAVGLIHRDIKPANVILCEHARRSDLVKVVDFGLVKELSGPASGLSEARVVTGTPLYMSPEAITRPSDVDERSDLYALGAVGYFLLTGEPVFDGKTVVEVCGAHLHKPVVPPSLRAGAPVPAELEALVLRCLAKRRDERPASADEVVASLRAMKLAPWTLDHARAWWAVQRRDGAERVAPSLSGTITLSVAPRRGLEATPLEGVANDA